MTVRWGTTDYLPTPEGHAYVPDPNGEAGRPCGACAEPYWADAHRLVETHRDLTPAELRTARFAVEASDDGGRTYAANGLRWTDPASAGHWASGLAMRWFGCTNIRVVLLADAPPMGAACGCSARPLPHTDDEHPTLYTVAEVITQTL